jgi:hypothetical protein
MTTDECCFGCDAAISTDDEYEVITYENGTEEYWHSRCLADEPEEGTEDE